MEKGELADTILVDQLSEGNVGAFDKLYMRYSGLVESFAFAVLRNRDDALDVTQTVFLKVWNNRPSLKKVRSFKSYLYTMTRNAVFDVLGKRHITLDERYMADVLSAFTDPQETAQYHSLQSYIAEIKKRLSSKTRTVFEMSREEGLSHKEISEAVGISPRSVEYHITKALSEIKRNIN